MFDIDSWLYEENRGDRQKEIEFIELPYKCGKIEAEIIASRFNTHRPVISFILLQPSRRGILL